MKALRLLVRKSLDILPYHYVFLIPFLHFRYHAWTHLLSMRDNQAVVVAVAIPATVGASLFAASLSRELLQFVEVVIGSTREPERPGAAQAAFARRRSA